MKLMSLCTDEGRTSTFLDIIIVICRADTMTTPKLIWRVIHLININTYYDLFTNFSIFP